MAGKGKRLLNLTLLLLAISLLQGCGFQLRGSTNLPSSISPVYIQGLGEYDELRRELAQMLTFSDIQVAAQPNQANTTLRISHRTSDRRVLSIDGNGNAAEYELHEGALFALLGQDGQPRVSEQPVDAITTYHNAGTAVLGKQEEEGTLRKDLQRDLASQILRKLQAQL